MQTVTKNKNCDWGNLDVQQLKTREDKRRK